MDSDEAIHAGMTVLETLQAHPKTQPVFEEYSRLTGTCLMCRNLFDTLHSLAGHHGLPEQQLLSDLRRAAFGQPPKTLISK